MAWPCIGYIEEGRCNTALHGVMYRQVKTIDLISNNCLYTNHYMYTSSRVSSGFVYFKYLNLF